MLCRIVLSAPFVQMNKKRIFVSPNFVLGHASKCIYSESDQKCLWNHW
jgi:hypothetical protein